MTRGTRAAHVHRRRDHDVAVALDVDRLADLADQLNTGRRSEHQVGSAASGVRRRRRGKRSVLLDQRRERRSAVGVAVLWSRHVDIDHDQLRGAARHRDVAIAALEPPLRVLLDLVDD
jgi:hypothetical protein